MHTRIIPSTLALLGAAWLLSQLSGCDARGQETAMEPEPATVQVAEVEIRDTTLWGSFTGRLVAPQTVELRPRVSGYIDQVRFEEGELVNQGDVLFIIDQRPYQARERAAAAELERLRSQLALSTSEARRAELLWERRAISREEFEQRSAAQSMAQAALNAAQAALDSVRLDLHYTEVRAPISGRIGRALVTPGNLASADTTVLTTLVSVDPLHVYFDGDQQTSQASQALLATRPQMPVRVSLAGERSYSHSGHLDFIDNQLNSATGTLQFRAVLANPDGLLRPGQFARVEMPIAALEQAILIDQKAILTDQDRRYVYVLDDDNRAQRRTVQTGQQVDGQLLIRNGLQPGDRVVVNGLQRIMYPGMPVTPEPVVTPAPTRVAQLTEPLQL